jgi:dTDP-glucose 4,6-dehydratase
MLRDITDALFEAKSSVRERFPASPAASGVTARSLITFIADRPGHDRSNAIDDTRTERELGFRLPVAPAAGLGATVRWFINNEAWWRAVMGGS